MNPRLPNDPCSAHPSTAGDRTDGGWTDGGWTDGDWTDGDLRLLLAEVQRFRQKSVQPLVARPEQTLDAVQLARLTQQATEFGLLNPTPETGAGLWEDTGGTGWVRFGSAALRSIAQANAGVAFHFHQRALADYVRRRLGWDRGPAAVVCWQGRYGLARTSLARLLKAKPLTADDQTRLQDYFFTAGLPAPKPLLFQAADDWQQLLVPSLDDRCQLRWSAWSREDLQVEALPHSHGLNETLTWSWQPNVATPRRIADDHPAAVAVYAAAFQLDARALIAIGWGAVQQAYDKAREYAALRRQGGAPIQQHDAVRLMLARTASVLRTVQLLAEQLACLPVADDSLSTVLAVRAETHALLCAAASEALQVLGGAGYMCEAGLEKILRDSNHLRLLGGTPDELRLFLSEWDNGGEHTAPTSLPNALTGHLPADHPLSPRQAFAVFPPLTQRLVCYEPAWIWDQDTAALPPALAELRRQTRDFAARELRPRALACDLHPHQPAVDAAVLQQAAQAGVLFSHLPPPLGTGPAALADLPLAWAATVKVEELCAACGGWGLMLSAHALGLMPLLLSGDKKIWKRFLIPARQSAASGTPYLFAFAITEPSAGSDVEDGYGASRARPETVARRGAGGWVLNGRKQYISGGDVADAVTVFAALEGEGLESWTCFLVPRGTPGFRWLRNERKLGQRASGTAELELQDVFIPDDQVIGPLRSGWALNRASLSCSRMPVAAIALGIARGAMEAAIDFVCQYRLGGRPLIDDQLVQLRVAEMLAETSAMRAMIWQLASRPAVTQANAAMSKFRCSEAALQVCETALQLFSQHGVLHRNDVEKRYRDARLNPIYEGTNQLNRLAVIEDFQEVFLGRATHPDA